MLPNNVYMDAGNGLRVASPELVFVEMGAVMRPEVQALLGYELTGSFSRSPLDPRGGAIAYGIPPATSVEKIEQFDPNDSALATQDMLKEFGVGTVLATWLNHDGYGLTREAEKVDLAGYEAYLCGHHLYLVNANFGAKNVKALLEKYETDKAFTPDKIVLFGYSFAWKELEELDTNLKKLKTTRNINADLDIRY